MTEQLTTTSILSLFDTTKEQRESFALDVINRLEAGDADPLKVHLQVKCMEEMIKTLTANTRYKSALLDAAEKHGTKSFQFHNAKFDIREVGTKYDYSNCGDPVHQRLDQQVASLTIELKAREKFLQTMPEKGMPTFDEETGEALTLYPPSKTSTTSVAVTLK